MCYSNELGSDTVVNKIDKNKNEIFLSLQHAHSKLWAIFEDNGMSAWLYVAEPEGYNIISDCFVYNRVDPINYSEISTFINSQPPISKDYATPFSKISEITSDKIKLLWNDSGNSTCVVINEVPYSFIVIGEKHGYSKSISKDGPFGRRWNENLFNKYHSNR